MYEQEKQRATHLMILLCFTILTAVLTGESILLGWEPAAVVLLIVGLAACWVIHITEKLSVSIRLWLYCILMMLAFFFYGIHETSIYDLAPVMIVVIIMYSATGMYSIIRLCMVTYYLTMCYDFVFVLGRSWEFTPLSVTRTLLHLALVFMAGLLAKSVIHRHGEEKKNTENRIAELEEINRRTEDFLANVSHELRTPINAVTGITAVMLKNEEDAGKKKDILSVQQAGRRLLNQIEDILDYTEIDTGRIVVSEDAYKISSLMNDVITGNRFWERENMPELVFDLDPNVPSVLLGDGRKIKKIVKHLVENAIKFTKTGGVYVRVSALPKAYGVNLCIRVRDTGVGIDEEELDKIKEKFYQTSGGRNRKAGGLGLGLSIVYGMVTAMEGFMQIESAVGRGTTMSVSIPQKVSDVTPCMAVADRASLCPACFLRPEKYETPEVREFYNEMISHMVRALDLPLHRASTLDELDRLTSLYQLTHLFVSREEYEENSSYLEGLDPNITVVVAADDSFVPPQGSRVKLLRKPFFCLPVINILNAGASEAGEPLPDTRMICPGVKVLVVDDEPMNLMVAEEIFKDYQMDVKTAESGREAIALCDKEEFDLIFLDHMMPEMDGVETLKQLRKLQADPSRALTAIAFTANAVSGAREMLLQEGFDEFISKPIEPLELERVLRKVLSRSSIEFVDGTDVKGKKAENAEKQDADAGGATVGPIPEKQPEEDRITRLENAGINTQSGLHYCQNSREFYEELLIAFARDTAKKGTAIQEFFAREDLENYRILVHALKSTAKTVGADALSELAKRAEDAAKNSDTEYINGHHQELLAKYKETAQRILDILDSGETASAPAVPANGTEVSREELIGRLRELKDSIDTCEADKAEALIADMSGLAYQGTAVVALLGEVSRDVDAFELDAAFEKVDSLIRNMEGGE